jgi:hypothetical protein
MGYSEIHPFRFTERKKYMRGEQATVPFQKGSNP